MSKKSSTPKKVNETISDDKDGGSVTYYFQHSADRTQVMITLISTAPISGTDEVLAALQCFIDDAIEQETKLFSGADIDAGDGAIH